MTASAGRVESVLWRDFSTGEADAIRRARMLAIAYMQQVGNDGLRLRGVKAEPWHVLHRLGDRVRELALIADPDHTVERHGELVSRATDLVATAAG